MRRSTTKGSDTLAAAEAKTHAGAATTAGTVADTQGKWSVQNVDMGNFADSLTHTVTAIATSPGGAASSPETHTFSVDKTPPKPHFSTFGRTQIITAEAAKNDVTFRGSSAEADTTLSATWNGKPVPISHTVGSLWKSVLDRKSVV